MKAKFGAIVVAGSGKIGGHVASRNRAGAYFRTKVTPVNPSTDAQRSVRSLLTNFSQAWRGLTQEQRDTWNGAVSDYAKTDVFGDLRNPTGFNLYVRLNSNLASVRVSPLTTPIVPQSIAAPESISVSATETGGVVEIEFAPEPIPDAIAYQIWATAGQSPGVNFVKSEFRQISYESPGATTPLDVTDAYALRFGAPIGGTKLFVQIVPVNILSGQKGQPLQAFTIVVS